MKKLCLCLTLFAALLFFAGCGNSKKDSGNETPDSEATVTDEDTVDADQADDTEPADDSHTETTEPTDDSDMEAAEPTEEPDFCNPNPCEEIANSTGICTIKETHYICECDTDYNWNGFSCVRSVPLSLGNICTGQTTCYDMSSLMDCPTSTEADFYGQDWQYAALGHCTPQSFTALPDVIVDNNTGLIWEKSPSSGTYTWEDAPNHCNDLNEEVFAGIDSWRVPNTMELLTIVDNSKNKPAINSNFTKMTTDVWTSKSWKSSYEGVSESNAYYFSPSYGSEGSTGKTEKLKVLCVSGDEMQTSKESDFEISEDEMTVTDKRTGLVWERSSHSEMDWKAMLAYCQSLNSETETGWRLPNKNEIASLLDHDQARPYSNFPGMYSDCLWSSSTFVYKTGNAWEICQGDVASYHKDFENNSFRCVK